MVVMTTVRGAKRTNKDNKGYEITRTVVMTAVRGNPNEQGRKGSKCSNGYKRHPGEKKPKGDYKLV